MRASDRSLVLIFCLAVAVATGAVIALGHEIVTVVLLGAVLYGILFLQSPAVALLAYVATRPAVDAFVLVDAGPLTVGQLWGAGLLIALIAFLVGTQTRSRTGSSSSTWGSSTSSRPRKTSSCSARPAPGPTG